MALCNTFVLSEYSVVAKEAAHDQIQFQKENAF